MSEGGQETKIIRCNLCKVDTHHTLRARYSWLRQIEDDDGSVIGTCDHRNSVWSCAGCDTVTFEWQMVYDDGTEGEGGYVSTYESIPHKLFRNLSPKLDRLYKEVVTCFEKDCLLLCTLGLRALVEAICVDKGLTEGNLERQIDGLIKFLPSVSLIEALHTFRFAGNDAAHRLEALTEDQARTAISIIEDLLNFLYDLDYKASQMRSASTRAVLKSVKLDSVQ